MDGQLEGMESFFEDYKRKAKEAEEAGLREAEKNGEVYARFLQTARRRRLLKKQTEQRMKEFVRRLTTDLMVMTETPEDRDANELAMVTHAPKISFHLEDVRLSQQKSLMNSFPKFYAIDRFSKEVSQKCRVWSLLSLICSGFIG